MNRSAECVIVGGGVIGLSIAYHLAARGMRDVVVLEKERLFGTGSTGRCAGGFRHQFSHDANIRLSKLSIGMLLEFEREMGQSIDLHQDGYLFLLDDPGDVAVFESNAARQRALGVAVEILDPKEIAGVLPGVELDLEGVLAASYCPWDGVSDPGGVTEGYRRNCARLGVELRTNAEVTKIRTDAGRVVSVETRDGTLATPRVVNAAGPHAGEVGRMAAVEIPVVPLRRCIWTTRPFAGAPRRWTLVIDFSTGLYFHREGGGVLFGMGNRDEAPTFDVSVDAAFLEDVVAPTAATRFPALVEAEIHRSWAGSYETSPDAHAILGRVPGTEGLFLANGFSGHGFQQAPGVGLLLAEEILDGAAHTLDLGSFSISRFERGTTVSEHGVV